MSRFLCIGECMVELAQTGPDTYRRGFAGDTFNTAWYARRCLPESWDVSYATAVGTDATSAEMTAFMQAEGVSPVTREIPDRTVGLYMIATNDGERSFSYWRSHSAARLLGEDTDWLASTFATAEMIHFSGITLAILAPDQRSRLCNALRSSRATVSFDTNLRPRLWENENAMKRGLTQGASAASIVLPSFDEETALFGDPTPEHTIARYREAGASIIAVKNGAEALTLATPEGITEIACEPVDKVVDSTAAGDSFAARFLAGLAQQEPPAEAARAAMGLAAKVIRAPGALVPDIFSGDSK
ncbi:sugar kinase [Vannielia litorea]|uniref:sugar kinase n=1 Tax=Vannielia litorea TaxID=1217970 RepID=UPI001C958902|nr:sugar kinase [Vannielia litorea]MBY6048897.1 sugar kinase [Vannielia litorea]MBY6076311.1 sugar kinase [Vannielia litorea]